MSLKDIGKYADIVKDFEGISSSASDKFSALVNAIDDINNIDEVNKLLKMGNVPKDIAEEALEKVPHFADILNDTVKGAAEGAEAMSNLAKATDGLKDGADAVDDLGNAFKGLGVQIGKAFKALAMNPITWLVGATAIGMGLVYLEATKFKRAMEEAEKAQSKYTESANELKSLQSELDSTSSKIDELESKGTLTITEEGELEKLKAQNAELERQIKLKEKSVAKDGEKSAKEALDILNAKDTVDLTQKGTTDNIYGMERTYYKSTDIITASENELKRLQELKDKKRSLLAEYNKEDTTKKRKKTIDTELESLESEIKSFDSSISRNVDVLNSIKDNLIDQVTGEVKSEYSDLYEQINAIIDDFNNIDLTPSERTSAKLDSLFNSKNLSFAKNQLVEMASKSELTAKDIERMGIAIEGVDVSTIAKYFNDMANSAERTANATTKFGTLEEYESALETENAGADYLKIEEGLKSTKELWDKGLVGTDEFKSFAKMLSPSGATDADNYIENYKHLKKYFTADSNKGVQTFLSELSKHTDKAGESFAEFDKKTGEWKLNIEDTTEAAKALQMGIVPFEAMLGRLKDYDFDIEFTSAVEQFTDVKSALSGFDSVLDRMADGKKKDALKEQVEGWKSQLDGWENDLSTLDTDIAMKIKLEYSLAEIQAQIDEFKSEIDWGNATTENYANLLAGNDKYISQAKESLGLEQEGIKIPVQFKQNENSINELREQLSRETNEENKIEIQAKIANLQDMQKDVLDAFSDAHPEINMDSTVEETNKAWEDFTNNSKEYGEIVGKYDIDTSLAKQKIDEISGETITMSADASIDQVKDKLWHLQEGNKIIFTATLDGNSEAQIEAERNKDGTISYYANLDGVRQEVSREKEQNGTIYFTTNSSEVNKETSKTDGGTRTTKLDADTTAVDAETAKTDGGTRVVTYTPNTAMLTTYFPPITRYVNYIPTPGKTGLPGAHGFNGTAHAIGTAHATGDWGAKKSEKALVGELGRETIVRGSEYFTVGDNGAELTDIRKGDIIFNH